ncbi:ATP-binding cassette, subfamily B [Cryptosporangium aurantiacum]|uniref:ATP-binding cassette, subfamily B n=2 Tax=Cryptosporangium aurantiacum TaxID=134849 RepID=A0A1M7J9Q2_9ACTN|nr:ABC transporter ATP-binding protein [Cryptosporangium aurantiacum]SHM49638.1 ATP-binding cassette, subfamily B [Cryptosporangium aurantiacum]
MTEPMAAMQLMRTMRRGGPDSQRKLPPGTAKRILAFARPYRRDIAVFLLATVVSAVIAVVTPVLAGRVVDAISRGGPRSAVVTVALVIAGLAVVDTVLSMVGRWFSSRIGEGIILSLRSRVFGHVQRMPVAFFSRTQTGALVSRLNNDVIGAQRAFTSTLSGVVSNVIALVLTLAVMLTLSWQITLAALVLLPIFVLPARRVGRRLAAITREAAELNASMNTTMTERFNVAGAVLVKLFGRPDEEEAAFTRRAARVRDVGILSAVYSRAFFAALTLVAALATALVYGVGGSLALAGSLSAGTVVSLALLLTRLYGPLTALSNVQLDVASALVSFDRVFEVLDLPPMITEKPNAVPVPAGARSVEFRNVSFSYPAADEVSLASLEEVAVLDTAPRTRVLHDVDFTARPGQLVALVGPSGAGKTTISQLIPRLYDVDAGAVLVGGVDVRDATTASLRDAVGVVTQEAHLFHDTIRANLLFARPGASDDQLWDALRRARIEPLVRSLPDGLDTVVGERGHRLSGGEKQRLAIARLLLKAPGVVILDEATAHLDSDSERAVQQALDEALADRTAIVIAHRLSTVRDADLILVVQDGHIVERGTHESLLAAGGLYAGLYETQFAPAA